MTIYINIYPTNALREGVISGDAQWFVDEYSAKQAGDIAMIKPVTVPVEVPEGSILESVINQNMKGLVA